MSETKTIEPVTSAAASTLVAGSRTRGGGQSSRTRNQSGQKAAIGEDQNNGPNTRSRKRRNNDHQTTTTSQPAARKRARAKQGGLKKPPPGSAAHDDDKKPAPVDNCCICMCDVTPEDAAGVNGCEHRFCFGCIEKWAERENSCPLCKSRFHKIDRLNKKRKKGIKNTKKVKQRDQRSDFVPGAALEGLLGRIFEDSRYRTSGRGNSLTDFFSPPANFASRHPNPSITRLIFSGVNGLDLHPLSMPQPVARLQPVQRGVGLPDEISSFDSDDDASPLSTFIRAFHGHSVMQVMRPVAFATHISSRSYASNVNDRNAGSGLENPLEIIDESDDDDTVEVVGVRNT